MNTNKGISGIFIAATLGLSSAAQAELSTTWSATTDYIFDGVSVTQGDAALQASLDYAHDSGLYASIWSSNVSFPGPDDDQEVDYYLGYYGENGDFNYDIGWMRYTYIGIPDSADFNYNEISLRLGYKNSAVQFWRSGNYANTHSRSFIWRLSQSFPLKHGLTAHAQYTVTQTKKINSLSSGNGAGEDRWENTIVGISKDWQDFTFDLSYSNHSEDGIQDAEGTNIAQPVWYFTVSRTFSLLD